MVISSGEEVVSSAIISSEVAFPALRIGNDSVAVSPGSRKPSPPESAISIAPASNNGALKVMEN